MWDTFLSARCQALSMWMPMCSLHRPQSLLHWELSSILHKRFQASRSVPICRNLQPQRLRVLSCQARAQARLRIKYPQPEPPQEKRQSPFSCIFSLIFLLLNKFLFERFIRYYFIIFGVLSQLVSSN